MTTRMKSVVRESANSLLAIANLKLVSDRARSSDYRDYIPLRDIVAGADEAGMSVGDYIDVRHNVPGATQKTIDEMAALGVFDTDIKRVCEIGPGSGRYLERVWQLCDPDYYEVYETSEEWATWLSKIYPVAVQPTDGESLAATASDSIDLAHSHKVFPGQPSLVMLRYFNEMIRVVRPGGKVVFDIVTEACMSDDVLAQWLGTGSGYQHYPCLFPHDFAVNFFCERGFSFDGGFLIPMKPGLTNYLVFTKKQQGTPSRNGTYR